jgi:[NiFe] hydrogenase small subunit
MDDRLPQQTTDSELGVSRRDFLKYCSTIAAAIGLGPAMGSEVAAALASASRPRVLWLHFAECTACTEAVLRTMNTAKGLQAMDAKAIELSADYHSHTYFDGANLSSASIEYFDDLILQTLSLDYHETLMAGAGSTVHEILTKTAEDYKGKFICVVEGAIPGPFEGKADDGYFGTINGRTMLSIAREILPKAKCIIALGNCASFGGIPYAKPNPSGAKNVIAALKDLTLPPVLNVPGCPPNPVAFVGTVAYLLLKDAPPPTDVYLRPKFAYYLTVHSQCPYIADYKAEIVNGKCLRFQGCKGPAAGNMCPTVKFNNGANFPQAARHVCIACSEPNFWDEKTPFWKLMDRNTPFKIKPKDIFEKDVSAMVVPDPKDGVLPYSKNTAIKPLPGEADIKTFNALGRRVKLQKINKNGKMAKQPTARGMFIEKTKEKARKVLEF